MMAPNIYEGDNDDGNERKKVGVVGDINLVGGDEQAIFTKSEIYELMGQLALPPYLGHPEADHWDCAPLAEHIITVVEKVFGDKMPGGRVARRIKDSPQA